MTRLADLAALGFLGSLTALLATANAQDRAVIYEKTKPAALPSPPPRLRIVSPTPKQVMTTQATEKGIKLPCLLASADRSITVAADGWPVKPGGPGVLVVLDGTYAANVHDLSKPISMESLEPMTEDKNDSLAVSPISACGWHSVAVVPTLASGQMLPVPPVVSWYYNKPARPGDEPSRTLEDFLAKPLLVINWPLMGTFYAGDVSNDAPAGWTLTNASKLPFDYTIAQGPKCKVRVQVRDQGDFVAMSPGLTYIKNLTGPKADLDWEQDCGDGPGLNTEGARLYVKTPGKVAARKWPTMSAAIAAADRKAERAAHRLPGKRPYDGVYHAGGGESAGDASCPHTVKVANSVLDLEVSLGQTMTYGSFQVKADADGFVDPQTVKLPSKAKPLPGRAEAAKDWVDAVRLYKAVAVQGDFRWDDSQGAHGKMLNLRLDLLGADGEKTSSYCSVSYLIEGFKREVHDCDTDDACGTPGHLQCCRRRP